MSILNEMKDLIAKNLPQLQATALQEYIKNAEEQAVKLDAALKEIERLKARASNLEERIMLQDAVKAAQVSAERALEQAKKEKADILELRVANRADVAEAKADTLLTVMNTIFRNTTVSQMIMTKAVNTVPGMHHGDAYPGSPGTPSVVQETPVTTIVDTTQR